MEFPSLINNNSKVIDMTKNEINPMILRGISYSEFDNVFGPQLKICYPTNIFKSSASSTNEWKFDFDNISDYVIVGKQLCHKVITIQLDNETQYMNYSIALENAKYDRNTFLFSFGFILHRFESSDEHLNELVSEVFEPVLKKMSSVFLCAEVENEFLYQVDTKNTLANKLQYIYESLVKTGKCYLPIDNNINVLVLQLQCQPKEPVKVFSFQVPILLIDKSKLVNLSWDITLKHLLPYIDNVSHCGKLAFLADMDVDVVCRCVQLLLFYKIVMITDVFKPTNIYKRCIESESEIATSIIKRLLEFSVSPVIYQQLCDVESLRNKYINCIQEFLTYLRPGVRLMDLQFIYETSPMKQTMSTMVSLLRNINLYRFLAICQHMQVLRRVHEYPAFIRSTVPSSVIFKEEVSLSSFHGFSLHGVNTSSHGSFSSHGGVSVGTNTLMSPMKGRTPYTLVGGQDFSFEMDISSHSLSLPYQQMNSTADGLRVQVRSEVIESLHGDECLDEVCVTHSLAVTEVLEYPGIVILYK